MTAPLITDLPKSYRRRVQRMLESKELRDLGPENRQLLEFVWNWCKFNAVPLKNAETIYRMAWYRKFGDRSPLTVQDLLSLLSPETLKEALADVARHKEHPKWEMARDEIMHAATERVQAERDRFMRFIPYRRR